jgi:hypothetical protein
VHGDLALVRELEDGGRAHPGQHGADRWKVLDPRIQHHVAPPAGGDDAGEHQLEPVHELESLLDRSPTPHEHRLRGEERADRPQAVRVHRRARRDEVDDRVGQPEPWRRLDRARDVDELAPDAALPE